MTNEIHTGKTGRQASYTKLAVCPVSLLFPSLSLVAPFPAFSRSTTSSNPVSPSHYLPEAAVLARYEPGNGRKLVPAQATPLFQTPVPSVKRRYWAEDTPNSHAGQSCQDLLPLSSSDGLISTSTYLNLPTARGSCCDPSPILAAPAASSRGTPSSAVLTVQGAGKGPACPWPLRPPTQGFSLTPSHPDDQGQVLQDLSGSGGRPTPALVHVGTGVRLHHHLHTHKSPDR
ncbi:hypothetical protein F4780DRAFT_764222 [Xylariomycetidae sp. FL0641]|nr:hypothetical protein F4780DRAFT_764222 [Xylariomycetidae sp. FL0641]